jgi:hypothetical protein
MEKRPRGRPSKVTDAMKIEIIDAFRHGAHVKDVMRELSHGIVHGINIERFEMGSWILSCSSGLIRGRPPGEGGRRGARDTT